MFVQPFGYQIGNLGIVHLLEHKVAVAFDAHVGKMDDSGITSVLIIMFGKVAALVQHHLPKTCRLDVLGTIHDVVAEEEEHRHLGWYSGEPTMGAKPGSMATMAAMFSVSVCQPTRPPCEWVM